MKNFTNLGRDGTFDTAELLDGTVEIVSVANHDAHYKLHLRLWTDKKLKHIQSGLHIYVLGLVKWYQRVNDVQFVWLFTFLICAKHHSIH